MAEQSKVEALAVQYDTPHAAGRDRRGVCISSMHNEPLLPFTLLVQTLSTVYVALNPNVVRFRMPFNLRPPFWPRARAQLEQAFASAFPFDRPANVRLFENAQGFRNVDIETPYDNVTADEIIEAAAKQGWRAGHTLLGAPVFVGLPSKELVLPVKLDNVPLGVLGEFVDGLSGFFAQFNPASAPLRVVDVWRIETKVCMPTPASEPVWLYADAIVVLIEFLSLPGSGRVYDLVHDGWPGWVMWRNEVVVHLHCPGKFDYCQFCKYHAQALEGEGKRHTIAECTRKVCAKCGSTGHFDSHCRLVGPNSQYKRGDGDGDGGFKYGAQHRRDEFNAAYSEDRGWRSREKDSKSRSTITYGSSSGGSYWDAKLRRTEGLAQTKLIITQALAPGQFGKSDDEEGEDVDVPTGEVEVSQAEGEENKEVKDKEEVENEEEDEEEMDIPGSFPTPPGEARITL